MEIEFTIEKTVTANGRPWNQLIAGIAGSRFGEYTYQGPDNLFRHSSVREAWKEMEKDFCTETVERLVEEIHRYSEDPEEKVLYSQIAPGKIAAVFYPKWDTEATGAYGVRMVMYELQPVEAGPKICYKIKIDTSL